MSLRARGGLGCREAALWISLEPVELVGERELDLLRERAPVVGGIGIRGREDGVELFETRLASEIDTAKAEPARDRNLLGSQVEEERAIPLLGQGEQLVCDDDAGDPSGVEDPCRPRREHVDVREDRHVETVQGHPAQELVVLACVVADLVDHEAGAVLDLLAQLEILRHDLTLVSLVVRDDTAEEEVRRSCQSVLTALVHVGEHAQQSDRVDVEHGRRDPPVARHRVVARQREHVMKPFRPEFPAAALERVAIPVFAREVDDHLLAALNQVGSERVRSKHCVAARVVGDREHVDPRMLRELTRQRQNVLGSPLGDQAAAGHELGGDDEAVLPAEELPECRLPPGAVRTALRRRGGHLVGRSRAAAA